MSYDATKTCYVVSFNNAEFGVGGCDDGESETQDFYGHAADKVVEATVASDPTFKLRFVKSEDDETGYFFEADGDDEYPIAVMYEGHPDFPEFVE